MTTPDAFQRLSALFHQAVDLTPAERTEFLDGLRSDSAILAQQLEEMLVADQVASAPVRRALDREASAIVEGTDPFLGEMFGAYRAEELLGHGGMGAVYLARRANAEFEQRVAIKTIRAGFESPELVERFRREREILAQLDHPGVARLIDGGSGPNGIPYVAMEFVEGESLMTHVHLNGLDLKGRLALFLELCDAIEFVHSNLVIHRDIKPSNVMVTREGRVKLLDFGIAKLTDEFEEEVEVTATANRILTPAYASPEQILGRPISMVTDVYALGALLYELLTGTRPIEFPLHTPWDMAKAIVEQTPPEPSEVAPARIARRLRGDLDRIVMMALRKEPERRYASAVALATDVRNHLGGWPVAAQADSWRYRTRKFLSRHSLASVSVALFLIVVVAFSIVTVGQRDRAREAERSAETKARISAASSAFLTRLFETADPREGARRNATALDLLHAGIEQLSTDETLDPFVRNDLRLTLGLALANLEEFEDAIPSLRVCIDERVVLFGEESLETAESKHRLGDVLRRVNDLDGAYELLSQALETRRRLIPGDSYELGDSLNNLAILAGARSQPLDALALQRESVAVHRRAQGVDAIDLATPLNNLGLMLRNQGKYEEALVLAQRSRALKERADGEGVGNALASRMLEAQLTHDLGQPKKALALFEGLSADFVEVFGPGYSRIALSELEIARCKVSLGEYEGAQRSFERASEMLVDGAAQGTERWAWLLFQRGRLATLRGEQEVAEDMISKGLDLQLALFGQASQEGAEMRIALAERLAERGALDLAREELKTALRCLPSPEELPWLASAVGRTQLARVALLAGRLPEARKALEPVEAILRETSGPESLEAARFLLRSSELERAEGNVAQAHDLLARADELLRRWLPANHPVFKDALSR
jgi:serine/threonine protein kinase